MVAVDQVAGAAAATRHLLELGHRTVWHVAGPSDWLEARQRIEGWTAALEEAGADVPPLLSGDWSARSGYELGRRLRPCATSPRSSPPTTRWRSACCAPSHEAGRDVPGRQHRRLRRHPRGAVLHAAADHRAPGLQRGRPAEPHAAARRDGLLDPLVGAGDRAAEAGGAREHGAAEERRTDVDARARLVFGTLDLPDTAAGATAARSLPRRRRSRARRGERLPRRRGGAGGGQVAARPLVSGRRGRLREGLPPAALRPGPGGRGGGQGVPPAGPAAARRLHAAPRRSRASGVAEFADALLEQVAAGRIGGFGVSNWTVPRLRELRTYLDGSGSGTCRLQQPLLARRRWSAPPGRDVWP